MRVLHLPVNNGSRTSHTVRALRQQGVDVFGLVRTQSLAQTSEGLKIVDLGSRLGSKYSMRLFLTAFPWLYYFLKFVRWADILHWYTGAMALPMGLDLAIAKSLRKPGIVEWQGADIRVPEVEFAENPYYTAVYHNGYEYQYRESLQHSRQLQHRFADAGFACLAPIGMVQYVQKDIFPHVYILPRRLILSDYKPVFPNANGTKPLVIHSPTAPVTKGTKAVLQTVEQLKAKQNFEFQLIQGTSRSQTLQLMTQADIFLDQFVLGDFGSASLEAMALGKPVVCYVKSSLAAQYPPDLPIVKATQDTLPDVLVELIKDSKWRHELGRQGRAYVEKYHDAFKVATQLKSIYEELLQRQTLTSSVVSGN
jgi:hypothetical protein